MIENIGQGDQDLDQEVVDQGQDQGTGTLEAEDPGIKVRDQCHMKDGRGQEIEGHQVVLEVEGHRKGQEVIDQGLEAEDLDQMKESLLIDNIAEGGQGQNLEADDHHHPHLDPVQNLQETQDQNQGHRLSQWLNGTDGNPCPQTVPQTRINHHQGNHQQIHQALDKSLVYLEPRVPSL